jgi:hypothetical protein
LDVEGYDIGSAMKPAITRGAAAMQTEFLADYRNIPARERSGCPIGEFKANSTFSANLHGLARDISFPTDNDPSR